MEKIDQLIHAKWIITCEDNNQILEDHAIAVKNGKIHSIVPGKDAEKKFDCTSTSTYSSHAIIPGLINSHTHLAMNVFRGLADDLELMDWLNNYIWPAEGKWVNQEMVSDASLMAMGEMIRCGTICFNDMYFFLDATAQAAERAGVRAHIGMTVIDVPTAWAKTTDEYFAKAIEFYQKYKNNPRVTPTLAPHSTYTVSIENLARVNELANEYDLKINIHLQESPSEIAMSMERHNERPLKRLNDIGMVSPRLIAVHMTQINDEDMAILKAKKPSLVHCPESNMKLNSGLSPVQKLLDAGINVALATDGAASNNDLDMIGEMRSAALLGKIIASDPKAISAETALKMATIHGARTLGIDDRTGSITPGKDADFIAIHLDEIETQPLYHPISQIVYASTRHQVTDVWAAGKHLLKNRELQTLDEKELIDKAKAWKRKIM
ncbi:MAG TPA: TRZ/ATZ family hydrolase [Gammaproteobacteria bacterium]|nr:TRZ/ATZ family hydrolase [Gammaproteobacteria bacterium]